MLFIRAGIFFFTSGGRMNFSCLDKNSLCVILYTYINTSERTHTYVLL